MTVQEHPAIYCGDELNKNQHSPLGVKLHILMWRECYSIHDDMRCAYIYIHIYL